MRTPVVTELPRVLEPVTHDPFADFPARPRTEPPRPAPGDGSRPLAPA